MSTEQKRERLAKLYDEATRTDAERSRVPWSKMHPDHKESAFYVADHILANGGDVILPPEPQWKPEQVVRLRLEDGMPYLAKRVDSNDGWEVFGVDVVITDDEVTDVEPVAVLTAEDVRELRGDRGISNFTRFFAERGLDL